MFNTSFSYYRHVFFLGKKNISIFNSYNQIIFNFDLDEQSSQFIKTMYIFNYYRLRKFLKNNNSILNKDIIKNERYIIKQMSKNMKIKVLLCKYSVFIFKTLQYFKHFKYKLYE